MSYIVTAPTIVVKIGDELRYLEQGAKVPTQADDDSVKHLLSVGLIEKVADVAPAKPADPAPPAPPADPIDAMKVDELKAYAAEKGFDLGGATKKADMIAAIAAARESE